MSDLLNRLTEGFAIALSPEHLVWSAAGVTLGTLVGVLPGFGPALTIALLLPLTWQIDADSALMLFAGIYYGAMYGGSTSAILLNVPGESATAVTAIEGHAMTRAGRAGAALTTAALGSFVAGTLGTVGITLLAEPVIALALRFGPAEYCVLMLIVMVTVTGVFSTSRLRGFTSLWLGIGLGLVGLDLQSGVPRMTFGHAGLFEGVDVVIVAMGLFAVGETLHRALRAGTEGISGPEPSVIGRLGMTRLEWRLSWPAWLRGTLIGFPLGALPAGGAELPTFVSYGLERRLAHRGTPFGAGAIAGVAGPEAANNAAAAGVLVPLLALGLPTSATAAILLSVFQGYGLEPGPALLTGNPALFWGLIASLYVANVLLLVLNLPLVGLWVRVLKIPAPWLQGFILLAAALGVWGLGRSPTDVVLLFGIGVLGLGLRWYGFPLAPVLIGLIVGPLTEQALRQALTISGGELQPIITRPLTAGLLAVLALIALAPAVRLLLRRNS